VDTEPAASPPPPALGERLAVDLAALDRELAEIDMLIGQARAEAGRHEQKRAQAAERLPVPDRGSDPKEIVDAYVQLATLTRRAAIMEAQVDVLEGKRKALARHRDALGAIVDALAGLEPVEAAELAALESIPAGAAAALGPGVTGAVSPSLARAILAAQEDLRREIARAMHDGPAQSLTNIVLQAEIVDRLVSRKSDQAAQELKLLVSMVQQTLEATKNFIFDVRPMVLDDLGLVPTLRRAARDRGRRAGIPVEFDSTGADGRLAPEVESTAFRLLEEALAGYLAQRPDRVVLHLDWHEALEARLTATRAEVLPPDDEAAPEAPRGKEVPPALLQMFEDRRAAHEAAVAAARMAAIVTLPESTRRELADRAAMIGATLKINDGELRLIVPPGDAALDRPDTPA
jgi:signal transduction histidine kinase